MSRMVISKQMNNKTGISQESCPMSQAVAVHYPKLSAYPTDLGSATYFQKLAATRGYLRIQNLRSLIVGDCQLCGTLNASLIVKRELKD